MSDFEYGPVVVEGRDFIAYRIAGAIAAVLLGIALLVQVWALFEGDTETVPEVRWVAEGSAEGGGGVEAAAVISARTRLQDERYRTGPAPNAEAPDLSLSTDTALANTPIEDPTDFLTEAWARPSGDVTPMLREPDRVIGSSSLPYANAELFERPFARDWRLGLADIATHLGALAILGFSFLLALILAIRGRVPIAEGRSGRRVKRFGLLERATHWMTSLSFIMLALTGSVIAFGDTLIRPFGEDILGDAGWLATWGHPLFFPPFALGLLLMFVMWVRRNLPSRLDIEWLKRAGGFFSDDPENPPARKFNAGQKLIFWSAVLGGGVMILSGIVLMFPFYILGLEGVSWAMLTHAVVGALLIAIFIGHIYIGTVGMQGAIDAMWGGDVDRNWAKEHHDLWLAEIENEAREGLR